MTNKRVAAKLTGIDPGIYPDLANEMYHSEPGISKSNLDAIHRSPAHFLASLEQPDEPTEAMMLGTAFHAAVLEPERFLAEYAVAPDIKRTTKAGKEAFAEWQAQNIGKISLSAEQMTMIKAMRESVFANPIAKKLVEMTQHEISVYADLDGVLCKCRPDGWSQSEGIMIDLKSAKDASPEGFQKAVANGRYHVQNAYYKRIVESLTGERQEAFYFLVCEKEPPFALAMYELDPLTVEIGERTAEDDLRVFRDAVERGEWNAYARTIQPLSLPRWAMS